MNWKLIRIHSVIFISETLIASYIGYHLGYNAGLNLLIQMLKIG